MTDLPTVLNATFKDKKKVKEVLEFLSKQEIDSLDDVSSLKEKDLKDLVSTAEPVGRRAKLRTALEPFICISTTMTYYMLTFT